MNDTDEPERGVAIPPASPCYQVYACGSFLVKRWDGTSYQPLPVGAWGGSHVPRVLLKLLLCSPGRQASRGRLLDLLWPSIDAEDASRYLSDAAYRLRAVLRLTKGGESLLLTAKETSIYALAGQEQLWVDADAALTLLEQAEERERRNGEALPLLEEAASYLSRGEVWAEEEHLYFYGRRARVARARRGCLLALAKAYQQQGWLRRAETLLSGLVEENVLDEDALCILMLNLHQQGRTSEGLRLYEETKTLLEREGLAPTEATRATQQQLREGRSLWRVPGIGEPDLAVKRDRRQTTIDWGEAPSAEQFYGREKERAALIDSIQEQHCRLVCLLGMGGIGKTSLAVVLVDALASSFDFVFWRSLQHAPSLHTLLQECLTFLSGHQRVDFPHDVDSAISLLITSLRHHRCLLILDNIETILQEGTSVTTYREGYEDYGKLLHRLGETHHQSCVLLTSREKPREVVRMQGERSAIRSFHMTGVDVQAGQEILKDKGLSGSDTDVARLIQVYSGNPLALKLIAEFIRELFHADIRAFLQEEHPLMGDIHDLLDQQFERLSVQEKDILYWLAIERQPVSRDDLWNEIVSLTSRQELFDGLAALRRRSLIEINDAGHFTLQPVVMEYVTEAFVQRIANEIQTVSVRLLASHALIKAQTKEYLRETQVRLILTPLTERLFAHLGKEEIEKKLQMLLSRLHEETPRRPSYAAGNLLNVMLHMHCVLLDSDFSHLQVRQAFLQGVQLPGVNFAQSDLSTSLFTDTFGSVFSVALNPAGDMVAAGTASGEVRLWNVATGMPLSTWQGHMDWVRSVAFSPDGSLVASGSEDQTIRLWDIHTGQCIKMLLGHVNRVRSVAFSPDGSLVASGSEDQTIRLWDVSTGHCVKTLVGHTDQVRTIAFSPDGQFIASGSEDRTVRLWTVSSGLFLKTLQRHTHAIFSVIFSPDGQGIASGSEEGTIQLWDVSSEKLLSTFVGHTHRVRSIAFSPDGRFFASGSEDRTVRLWDISHHQCLQTLYGHTGSIFSVVFGLDGSILITGSEDQTVRFWEAATSKQIRTLRGHADQIRSLAFSPDGNRLVSGSEDQTLRLWDVTSGLCLRVLQSHVNRVRAVAFSPDGQLIASGSEDQTVRLWSARSGQCLNILEGHSDRIRSVAFSPDGSMVASGSEDRTIRLWSVYTGQCVGILQGHVNRVRSLAFSPDGRTLVSGSEDQTIRLWNVQEKIGLAILQGHTNWVWSVAYSPDGSMIASGSEDQTVKIWNVEQSVCICTMSGHSDSIRSVAFSQDATMLVSGSEDQTVRLWDVSTGACRSILYGHTSWVWCVAFRPNSTMLASGSHDGTVKIWETRTGECCMTLRSNRPYERMNITGATGLTPGQKTMLKELGALEEEETLSFH